MRYLLLSFSLLCISLTVSAQQPSVVKIVDQNAQPLSGALCWGALAGSSGMHAFTDQAGILEIPPAFRRVLGTAPVTISVFHPDLLEPYVNTLAKLPAADTLRLTLKTFVREKTHTVNRYERHGSMPSRSLSEREGIAPATDGVIYSDLSISDEAPGFRGSRKPSGSSGGATDDIPVSAPAPGAGKLTATEVNDFASFKLWKDYLSGDLAEGMKNWKIFPHQRYTVEVQSESGAPLAGVPVSLMQTDGSIVWLARTDNTGKAELWHGFFEENLVQERRQGLRILVGESWQSVLLSEPWPAVQGPNKAVLPVSCETPLDVDLAIVLDATGSMGDELEYLKSELDNVVGRLAASFSHLNFRTGAVVYRDFGDEYLTRHQDLGAVSEVQKFLSLQHAGGGGDFPEAVEEGMATALEKFSWSPKARTKIMLLVLDAPPHNNPDTRARLFQQIRRAAAEGVRIIPLACSGIDKPTEFILRSLALATNGTYTSLTDDSGIGNSHIKPSTGKMDVQKVNDLLVKVVSRFVAMPSCSDLVMETEMEPVHELEDIDNGFIQSLVKNFPAPGEPLQPQAHPDFSWKLFPNPTVGPFTVDIRNERGNLAVLDLNGRLLEYHEKVKPGRTRLDASKYSQGLYFVVFHNEQRAVALKFIKVPQRS